MPDWLKLMGACVYLRHSRNSVQRNNMGRLGFAWSFCHSFDAVLGSDVQLFEGPSRNSSGRDAVALGDL